MYTGALAEKPLNGGFLGPTITCLLTDQFVRLKRGDRFWYETPEAPQAFTPGEVLYIKLKYPITGLETTVGPQDIKASRISRQLAHEGCNVVSPVQWPPSYPPPQEISLILISVRG